MPKRKKVKDLDLTNDEIERYVFPKKVRDAIHRIAETDDEPKSEEPVEEENSESSRR